MRSSDRGPAAALSAAVILALTACSQPAHAQQRAQGFAVERFYPSAPGGGWLVMDTLEMRGGLGGAVGMTLGYAHEPLRVPPLAVVSSRAFAAFGFAVTYDRFRFHVNLEAPLYASGESGTVGTYTFAAPSIDPGSHPDTITDPRLGVDVRLLGAPDGAFRLGAGAQLYVPNGDRADYVTDDTVRAMVRALFAGDRDWFTYAGFLGVHVRPLDDGPTPGSPRGSELLFGLAAGPRFCAGSSTSFVVGPEVFGQTAVGDLFDSAATGIEALATGRVEITLNRTAQLRAKVGMGGGLNPKFGAPEWRSLLSIEVVGSAR